MKAFLPSLVLSAFLIPALIPNFAQAQVSAEKAIGKSSGLSATAVSADAVFSIQSAAQTLAQTIPPTSTPSRARCKKGTSVNPIGPLPCAVSRLKGDLANGTDLDDIDPADAGPGDIPGRCEVTAVENGKPTGFLCTCHTSDTPLCYSEDDTAFDLYKEACAAANPPLTGLDFLPPIRQDEGDLPGEVSGRGLCSLIVYSEPQGVHSFLIFAPITSVNAILYAANAWEAQYRGIPAKVGQSIWGGCQMFARDRAAIKKFVTENYCNFPPENLLVTPVQLESVECCINDGR